MAIEQVEMVHFFDSNIYLVSGSKTVLIDAGTGFQADETVSHIKRMLNGRKLDMLILTHRHYDHVGGAAAIIKEFSPKVFAGRQDAEPLRKGDRAASLGTKFGGELRPMDAEDLKERDIIDIGEHRLRILETPGHTIGSICLSDEVTGALFSGDTVFIGGVGRWDLPTGSEEELIRSLKRLSKMNVNGFYPGHGPCVPKGGNEHIINGLRLVGAGP